MILYLIINFNDKISGMDRVITYEMFQYIIKEYPDHDPYWTKHIAQTELSEYSVNNDNINKWCISTNNNNSTRIPIYLLICFDSEEECQEAFEWIKQLSPVLFI